MRALSIRQPYAELILRGIKPIEFRSRPTRIIGERFYIYAAKQWAAGKLFLAGCRPAEVRDQKSEVRRTHSLTSSALTDLRPLTSDLYPVTSDNLVQGVPPDWMLELAEMLILKDLPTGVIVGSAVIEEVAKSPSTRSGQELYEWHLTDVERAKRLRKPRGHPQPVWFNPFD
jgi:hypothetical protein